MEGAPAEFVIADAAYDADHIRDAVAEKGAEAVIPNNPSRSLKHPLDKHLYAQRHLVECCIGKLKHFRRVATRYEKPPATTSPSSPSLPLCYGSGNCPHDLGAFGQLHAACFMRLASFAIVARLQPGALWVP
jgi:hypothetical protein